MAIQMRRGANSDFNPSKMLPGEIAVTTDGTRKVYAAFKANDVKELASKEDVQGLINGFTSVVDREIAEAEQRIESKGQQVLETIPDLYEEVSARADEAVRTKADAIVCSVSGVNPIAKDSSNDYLRNLKLFGKTTQGENPSPNNPQPLESVGKWGNLFDEESYPFVEGYWINRTTGAEHSGDSTSKATLEYIPVSEYAGKTLTINKIATGNNPGIAFYDSNKTYISGLRTLTFTVPTNAVYMRFCEDVTETDIMLNYGTTALPYRPYSGQKEVQSGVYGKNLSPVNNVTAKADSHFIPRQAIRLLKGETYTFSMKPSNTSGAFLISFLNSSGELVTKIEKYNTTPFGTITPTEDIVAYQGYTNIDNTYNDIQIELGSTITEYVPYTKQSHISLVGDGLKGIPLGKTIPDIIANSKIHMDGVYWDVETEQYYIGDTTDNEYVQRIGTKVYDGSDDEEWTIAVSNGVSYVSVYVESGNATPKSRESLCSHYIQHSGLSYRDMDNNTYTLGDNDFSSNTRLIIRDDVNATSLETWKAFLAKKPITLVYRRFTPIETPLSASELASYKALKSNYKVTSVMNDCGAFMEVQYNADTKTYMDNLINKLQTAIVALGGTL